MMESVRQLSGLLREQLGHSGSIPLHEPWIRGNAWAYTKDCLDSGWVSSAGKYVHQFESQCAEVCGVEHAIATVNGTSALHAALLAAEVKSGDAVLCPALSFVATVNAIAYVGAIPVFVDSDPVTLGMDHTDIERAIKAVGSRSIAACIPMHVFGNPVDMYPLLEVCTQFGIPVIEDAAESIGSCYNERACGSFGMAAVLSFNGNKIITTGGGGMILANDGEFAARARHLTTTARTGDGWTFDHDEVGYNYRMPSLNAALGCAQMEELGDFLARKRMLADLYREVFGSQLVEGHELASSNNWLNALKFKDEEVRDKFLLETNELGIQTRPPWKLLADLPMFRSAPRSGHLPVARDLAARLVNVPSSPSLIEQT